MSIKEVGKIEYISDILRSSSVLHWEINSFSMLPERDGGRIWSPEIDRNHLENFIYLSWKILVPRRSVGLIFNSQDCMSPLNKCIRLGIVDKTNSIINCCEAEWIEANWFFNGHFIVQELLKQTKLVNLVRLFCEVINKENEQTANVPKSKENLSTTKEEKGLTLSEHNRSKSDELWREDMKNLEKLSQNFTELYISGQDSDITINVKSHEFKAHKVILRARSSVFNAMFSHELSEKNNNTIPIEDCEPAVFEEFLFFIYSGRTRQLSSENACELYYVADKYLIQELKEECIRFLKKSLSIETICDVICLCTQFNETELLDLGVQFFARNMEEILLTVKWQLFMSENPTIANELTIKALRLGFTKKENLN